MSAVACDPLLTRGHKKKSRTRRQLLDAASEVFAERGEGFSIADVAARAGVSHGTFYNYFRDRDDLLDALVAHATEEFAVVSAREVDEADPVRRFARISARALTAAAESPIIVRCALRLEAAQRASLVEGPLAHLRDDLFEGHRAGRFVEPPDDAAFDVILGTLLLAARRVTAGETDADYPAAVIGRLLMALGVARGEAERLALEATAFAPSGRG